MRILGFLSLLAIAGMPATSARAGRAMPMALPELGQQADLIVAARVISARSIPEKDAGRRVTEYTAVVVRQWKGDRRQTVIFRVPEIEAEGLGQATTARSHLKAGEECFVMFVSGEGGRMELAAGAGPWTIRENRIEALGLRLDQVQAALGPSPDDTTLGAASPTLMTAAPGAIRFSLTRGSKVTAGVYDLAGRLVYSFPTLYFEPGVHVLRWGGRISEGDKASHGMYFVRLRLGDGTSTSGKLIWVR